MRTSPRPTVQLDPVLVIIDGSPTDLAVVEWAAREATQTSRPMAIVLAAGHLPPDLTYAERDAVRRQRLDDGRQVAAAAAEWAIKSAPGLCIGISVRLLPADLLLPAVAEQAHMMARSSACWSHSDACCPEAPVLVGHPRSAPSLDLIHDAADYARRQGVDLVVLEDDADTLAKRLVEQSGDTSALILSRPARSGGSTLTWPLVLVTCTRSRSPVVLVAPASRSVVAPGSSRA